MKNSKFAEHIAGAISEYLQAIQTKQIRDDEIYNFSMKIWFEFVEGKVKSINAADVIFKPLNKALNKKFRNTEISES